jgi:transcriptional regulator with XRE-family HTH domain
MDLPMNPLKTFGQRLREAREAAKKTQQEVADLFKPPLTRNAVSNWEADKNRPDADHLAVIARALKTSLDHLHYGRETPYAPSADDPVFLPQLVKLFRDLDDSRQHDLLRFANLLHSEQYPGASTSNPYPAVKSGNRVHVVERRHEERRRDERRRKA